MMEEDDTQLYSVKPYSINVIYSSPPPTDTLAKAQPGPLPRSGHRMICIGHKLYIFGGYNPQISDEYCDAYWQLTKPLFAELWEYNTTSGKWHQNFQCHMGRTHGLVSFGCAVTGNSMLHFGGTGVPFGETSNNWLYTCELRTGTWKRLETTGNPPTPAYGQGVLMVGPMLYVVGGTTGFDYNCDVHRIDMNNCRWEQLNSNISLGCAPLPRYRHEVVLWKDEILMLGGGQNTFAIGLDVIHAFSITSLLWRAIRTKADPKHGFPAPRKCHVAVIYNRHTYIHGGCDEHHSYGDLWRLSVDSWQWQRLVVGIPRHFHAAALTEEGCLYLHGGVIGNPERSGQLLQCWLTVPPLHRLALAATFNYYPKLLDRNCDELYKLGIPSIDIIQSEVNPDPANLPPRPTFPPEDDDRGAEN